MWLYTVLSVLTTLLGLIAPKGLDTNGTLGPMLGVHPLQLTDHNTGINLLLSTSVWVLLSPLIERRETGPTAERPCPRTVSQKKVAQSSSLNQAGDWTRYLLVGSQRSNQLR